MEHPANSANAPAADSACCDDVYRVAVEKKLQLAKKIKALSAMSLALSRLIDICSHDAKSLDECPILGALEAGIQQQDAADAEPSRAKGRLK